MSINENAGVTPTEKGNEGFESTTEETTEQEVTEVEETNDGETKGKPKRTPQEELAYFEGRAKRLRRDLGIEDEEAKPSKREKSSANDLAEKAYLAVNGIKSADEIEFFRQLKKETGKDADALLQSTYFQTEFTSFKEKKATANATPTGSKRSNNSSIDSVEYWIAKGELPPASEVELRRAVVNARMKKEESKGMFYNS